MAGDTGSEGGVDFDWSWTEDGYDWIPPAVDLTKPSAARMYDYALGGKDNSAVDRAAVEKVGEALPDFRRAALANRGFLVRAVRLMAESGIQQFIDLGTGIPTSPNVHEVARETHPEARVVYVDNDPVVIAHNRALRATTRGLVTVPHDLRQPAAVLADPTVRGLIDFHRPIGVLFVAVLHFVRHDIAPEIVAQFRRVMAPGSYLAISTVCTDGLSAAGIKRIESVYAGTNSPFVFRTKAQVEQLFEGFELVEPGLTDITKWRNDDDFCSIRVLSGVARKAGFSGLPPG
jgi:hypothetical protein